MPSQPQLPPLPEPEQDAFAPFGGRQLTIIGGNIGRSVTGSRPTSSSRTSTSQQHFLPSLHVTSELQLPEAPAPMCSSRQPLRPIHNTPNSQSAFSLVVPPPPPPLDYGHDDYQLFVSQLHSSQHMAGLTPLRATLGGTGLTPERPFSFDLEPELPQPPQPDFGIKIEPTEHGAAQPAWSMPLPPFGEVSHRPSAHHQQPHPQLQPQRATLWAGNTTPCREPNGVTNLSFGFS
jgi:hypothetical protein